MSQARQCHLNAGHRKRAAPRQQAGSVDTTASGLEAVVSGLGLPANAGGYAQIGGLKVASDLGRAADDRTISLAMIDIDGNAIANIVENGVVAAGAPATLPMTSLSFTANGGDGYPIKPNAANFRHILFDGSLSTAIDPTLDLTSAATAASVGQFVATIGPDTVVTLGASRLDVHGMTGLLASDFIFA